MAAERGRLEAARPYGHPWKKWRAYLSVRQWGTAREDYSESGNAWDYFSHDQARSRTDRWGEDSWPASRRPAVTLHRSRHVEWQGPDPREHLFGTSNSQSNHGEDVEEYYFYLDGTPSTWLLKCDGQLVDS